MIRSSESFGFRHHASGEPGAESPEHRAMVAGLPAVGLAGIQCTLPVSGGPPRDLTAPWAVDDAARTVEAFHGEERIGRPGGSMTLTPARTEVISRYYHRPHPPDLSKRYPPAGAIPMESMRFHGGGPLSH